MNDAPVVPEAPLVTLRSGLVVLNFCFSTPIPFSDGEGLTLLPACDPERIRALNLTPVRHSWPAKHGVGTEVMEVVDVGPVAVHELGIAARSPAPVVLVPAIVLRALHVRVADEKLDPALVAKVRSPVWQLEVVSAIEFMSEVRP